MTDFMNLLISKAYAADGVAAPALDAAAAAAVATPPDSGSVVMKFMPLFLIFMVFYFLVIRPQQKKLHEQDSMTKSLKKGDKVITNAGVFGTIAKLDGEDALILEIAKGVEIKMLRSAVSALADAKPANQNTTKKA